ncbi:MAG: peptidase C25, partial [Flavobacterium sp.]
MKKILPFTLLLLSPFLMFSQEQANISINWTEKKALSYGEYSFSVPQFNAENMVFDTYTKTLNYSLKIKLSGSRKENSLRISNLVYEPILQSQLGDLSVAEIPSSFKYTFKNCISRNDILGDITLSPIVKEGNSFKKLISFSYSFAENSLKAQQASNNTAALSSSVLSSGNWYRFYVTKSGVYKISKSFLQSLGFDTNVDPRKIKIYGNGGRMLPLLNATSYPFDLAENAIQFPGENDGVFNDEDCILFYAEGFDNWNPENNTHLNLYAEKSYYYVTSQGENGKRIADMIQPSGSATTVINTFNDYQFHEKDDVNIAKVGR